MLTAGSDRQFKVFDIRKTFSELYSYYTPKEASHVHFSQTNLVSVASGSSIYFWKDCQSSKQKAPIFRHDNVDRRNVSDCRFVPYEDFMGVCYNGKFVSVFLPESGSFWFDTFENNLNQDRRQNREIIVTKLLEKVSLKASKRDNNFESKHYWQN